MEFKDKLRKLRRDKCMTQQQLADAIFVSRSTVAKWENGLGLPNAESMQMLQEQFGVSKSDLETTQPEEVIVQKNRTLRLVFQLTGWAALIGLLIVLYTLPFAIHNGNYGITPDMLEGGLADREYIDTGDYRIYYTCFEGFLEDGRHWTSLSNFNPVQIHFWGCTVSEQDYESDIILYNNYMSGRLYSIKGKNGYYNLIKNSDISPAEEILVTAQSVNISGIEYELQAGFFFITQEPVEYFMIGDYFFNVE